MCPDPGCEPIDRIVRPTQQFFRIVKRNRRYHWPENFLLHDLHVILGVDQNRRLDKVSLVADLVPARRGLRALGHSDLKIVADALQLLLGNQRPHMRLRIESRPHFDLFCLRRDAVHYAIEDWPLHIKPRSRAAALAMIEEDCAGRAGNRRIQVRIFENYIWRLAT